jgi:hypothetical protein
MGNITIIQGKKPLSIIQGKKPLTITTEITSLPIVETMELNYQLSNNQWLFSLNGVTQNVKNVIDTGGNLYVQLVRDRGYATIAGSTTQYFKIPRIKKRPNFPNAIRDGYVSRFSINQFNNVFYSNMNLTTWMNGLISKLSVIRENITNPNAATRFKFDNGYWFLNVKFCIRVESSSTFFTANTGPYIKFNFYNNDNQNINTNYSLVNNEINIYSI